MRTTIPRRTVLKGLGAAVGLPLLEAMAPVAARGETLAAPPKRMAFVFFPNGAIMPSWTPSGKGTNYDLSDTLKPLESVRDSINIISGLAQDNGRAKGDGPGDHARCASTYLTGAHPVKTSGANIRAGVSVDQVAATQVGDKTRLPSLELGIDRGKNAGSCDSGYSCAYSANISWKTPNTPMAKEVHPRLVFERLFSSGVASRPKAGPRSTLQKSVLDLVAEDARSLISNLGQTDRRKLDEYLSSVRELEQRIGRHEKDAVHQANDIPSEFNVPDEIPGDVDEHIKLMYHLLALAFRTDSTRIATFMLGNAGSNRTYPKVGVRGGWHKLSHHRKDQSKIDDLKKVDGYLVELFAGFVQTLNSIPEGRGTVLDNCMIVYGSGLSDGNRHQHNNLPIVLAGKAGGTIRTGRHIMVDQETPMNNLFLSMLDRMGAGVKGIGDSSGRLSVL